MLTEITLYQYLQVRSENKMKANTSEFALKVLDIVRNIKKGKIMTYKEVAAAVGSRQGARAVGTVMKSNYDASVSCHRVVRSDGKIGDYNRGGQEAKIKLLKSEGVNIINGRVVI